MRRILDRHNVIVCTGSGGVGKTTIAAALGLVAARAGRKVLVLTVDPARRLAAALGLQQGGGVIDVALGSSGTLHAEMIQPDTIFEDYIRRVTADEQKARRILDNKLYQQLATTLSGSQEFTSLLRLSEAVNGGAYDLVVLDTPPTEHAAEFLEAPERLASLFDGRVARWLGSNPDQSGVLGGLVRRGTHAALSILQLLTGKEFIAELTGFFDGVRTIAGDIRESSLAAHQLLTGAGTAFVLVSSLDAAKILEAEDFRSALRDSGYRLAAVIVNRAHPEWFRDNQDEIAAGLQMANADKLVEMHAAMRRYYSRRGRAHAAFSRLQGHKTAVVKIADLDDEPTGLDGLERLGRLLQSSGRRGNVAKPPDASGN
jgi:anion-transporting  ArsA/GET3 family ATPase